MKNLLFVFTAALLIAFACKKKDDGKANEPNVTQISTTGTATSGTTGGTVATFSALCSNQKMYGITNNTTFTYTPVQNMAIFTAGSRNNFSALTGTFLNAGVLKLNNDTLYNASFFYNDTSYAVKDPPFVWACSGSGNITAFTYTNTNLYATYGDYIYWPDTINKSTGFSILFASLQRADEAQVIITGNGGGAASTYTALTSAGSISVSPQSLAALSTSATANIVCHFYKNNIQSVGGSLVNFRNVTTFVKTVQLKN